MRPSILAAMLIALGGLSATPPGAAMSSQELCEKVYEQYGIRGADCEGAEAAAPAAAAPEISAEMRESHVFFSAGGAGLDPRAEAQLAVLVAVLETAPMRNACLKLVGHSDSSGSAGRNHEIALARAGAVAERLRRGLEDGSRVRAVASEGEARPLPGFDGADPANRRVEILARPCD
ncbi:OmpA family protein [Shimia sp.]|uniref:OmpA family protein n=1 Tax=Shimia sp. TaxID=1954381 RepID=UPI003564BFCB